MKVFKIEVMVLDHDNDGIEEIKMLLENNRHISVHVMDSKSVDVEDYNDDHPLNNLLASKAYFDKLFN